MWALIDVLWWDIDITVIAWARFALWCHCMLGTANRSKCELIYRVVTECRYRWETNERFARE